MFVDDATFAGMWRASEERDFGADQARVPCLDHLLALKLHALKQARAHRTAMANVNNIDPTPLGMVDRRCRVAHVDGHQ